MISKIANIINKLSTNNLFAIIKFHFFLFKKSVSFIVLSILLFLCQPIILIIIFSLNLDLLEFSFIFNIISLISIMIWLVFLVNKLFSDNKTNGIDVIMLSKPISKYGIFFSRMLIIFGFLFIILFFQFLISNILIFSFSFDIKWIIYLLINNLFIIPFIAYGISAIFILFAVGMKSLWFGVASFITILAIGILPIFSRTFQENNFENKISYDNNNYNSFSKLTIFEQGEIKTFLVDQINPESQIMLDKNILKTLNHIQPYEYIMPGELISSLNSSLINSLNFENSEIKNNFSLLRSKFTDIPVTNINSNSNYIFSIRPEDISPLELNNVEYEKLLLDNIAKIVNNSQHVINLNDEKIIAFLHQKLEKSLNWTSPTLSESEFLTIRSLLGINLQFTQLFYYFNNYELLSSKTPNLIEEIKLKFNPSLANLLSFLWNNNNSQVNVFNLKSFGDVEGIFPNAALKSLRELPNSKDLNFIKNNLIRFSGSSIHYLDLNKEYLSTSLIQLQKISPTIIDQNSWNNFVNSSTITLNHAMQFNSLLNNELPNIFQIDFRPNSSSISKYSYFLEIGNTTYLDNAYLSIISVIFITISVNIFAIYIFKNKNYKN